jgi:hypothetical protein
LPSPAPDLDAAAREAAKRELGEGEIAWVVVRHMFVDRTYPVEVRIRRDVADRLTESLREQLKDLPPRAVGEPDYASIKVGDEMEVHLLDSEGAFKITSLSNPRQTLAIDGEAAIWQWDVIPMKPGNPKLTLSVTAFLTAPGVNRTTSIPVLDRRIEIEATFLYETKQFAASNWQWILTAILIPLGTQLVRKRRRNPESERSEN